MSKKGKTKRHPDDARRILHGIESDGDKITDIDPDARDEGIDLALLPKSKAERIDKRIREFFRAKGEEQGASTEEGDGSSGLVPWSRGLTWGEVAWKLDALVKEIPGMGDPSYSQTLWEAYEKALPSGLLIEGDGVDESVWAVSKNYGDCVYCGNTLTSTDIHVGECRKCHNHLMDGGPDD